MQAYNRGLPEWFTRVETGQLMLPRIQRYESWSHSEVVTLLDTVLRGHPIGAALVLNVGDKEKFVSRLMSGVSEKTERTTEHLLDGQQRLTALWKALNDKYDDRTYYAVLTDDVDEDTAKVTSVGRWMRENRRFPLWADDFKEQWSRKLVPMFILRPGVPNRETRAWCNAATDSQEASDELQDKVHELQDAVSQANLPYLSLPTSTPSHVAISVFIKMNTTSVQLSTFDIVVAQMEADTGESLHDLVDSLHSEVPTTERYLPVSDLVLRVAALREDRAPTESSFERLDLKKFVEDWSSIENGIAGAIGLLQEERVFDRDRLPTLAVIPVLAAIWSQMPQSLDPHGQARNVLRRYLWRSFFTGRYERAAATAALQDYRGLRSLVVDAERSAVVPIFDDTQFPIAEPEELMRTPWPKSRNTLARAILAVSLRGGGQDFADDTPATWESLQTREYHHLFPAALLRGDGGLEDAEINLALNCALVTWHTNRDIAAKEPVAYLQERVKKAGDDHILSTQQIKQRVGSHTIPFNELNAGGYDVYSDEDARAERIKVDYEAFLKARAGAVHQAASRLCNGQDWHGLDNLPDT